MFEIIYDTVKNNKGDREILIWGAWQRGLQLCDLLREHGVSPVGFIDKAKQGNTYHGLPCLDAGILNPQKYYVLISLVEHDSVFCILEQAGYIEYKDYSYPNKIVRIVQCRHSFSDSIGNRIAGTVSLENTGSVVSLAGASRLIIHENVSIGKNVRIFLAWNSTIELGENTVLHNGCSISASDNSQIQIGSGVVIRENTCVIANDDSKIQIGSHTDIGHDTEIRIRARNILEIGAHTLLSYRVMIRSGDGHAIIDLDSCIVQNAQKNICVDDHVWVCMCATLLGGTHIRGHSIVGANALVNKKFPKHVMLAGSPAKVIRDNVDWHMDENITWEEYVESATKE